MIDRLAAHAAAEKMFVMTCSSMRHAVNMIVCSLTLLSMNYSSAGATPLPGARAVVAPVVADVFRRTQARSAALQTAWRATHDRMSNTVSPVIVWGKILTPALDVRKAPAAPALRLQYTVDTPGLEEIDAEFTAPSGLQKLDLFYGEPYGLNVGSRTITVQYPQGATTFEGAIGHYAEPGIWRLTRLYIMDNAGRNGIYQGSEIDTIVTDPTFTLVNTDAPDNHPPTVSTGRIITKTVDACSFPPLVKLSVTTSDDVSGVASVGAGFASLGGDYFDAGWIRDAPRGRSGAVATVKLEASLSHQMTPGTYTIFSLEACDAAGNCFSDSSSADIRSVFGKSDHMQVTRSYNCK